MYYINIVRTLNAVRIVGRSQNDTGIMGICNRNYINNSYNCCAKYYHMATQKKIIDKNIQSIYTLDMITSAIQGRQKIDEVRKILRGMPYNPDLYKMLKTCESLCTEVSKKEVLGRNSKVNYHTEKPLKDLNECIDRLEKYIILAKLLG